ncbi:uncharacterized protein JCM15063_003311 [Sporobolomyces koalae]|uniref:uncharacterized protein n=1 Tax=Sporobolomyces koalae TaxID=500713 RepID=UPI00317C4F96
MNDTPAARFLRQPGDSSLPFNLAALSQSLLSSSDAAFTSPSDSESTSPSLLAYSSSGSPGSSLQSSPALRPKLLPALSSATDDLPLLSTNPARSGAISDETVPSTTDLSLYAASIIRNEAYALLSLAARLSPASQPIVSDEELDSANSEASSFEGFGFDEDTHPSRRQSVSGPMGSPILQESRTNVAFRQVVDLIRDMPAHGKVLVTGIGKSGIAGKKMVATFCSLGVQAAFLHPVEALHGDIGSVCYCSNYAATPTAPCDVLLLISHSGATAELMRLLPIIRPRLRSVVAVTRDPDSVLARACDGWLDSGTGVFPAQRGPAGAGTTDEADSALPAPTSSVVAALAIGDALALTLSRLKLGWAKDGKDRRSQFFHCHPGGQLGIQLGREGRTTSASPEAMPAKSNLNLPSVSPVSPIPASPLR